MKKSLLKIITALLCIPILFVCGCSSKPSKLGTINPSAYFEDKTSYYLYNVSESKTMTFDSLTLEEPDKSLANSYIQLEVKAKPAMIYKMYIDYIYFYVYTNKETYSEMIVNVSLTNLCDEWDFENPTDDFSYPCSFLPVKDGSTLCIVEVKKVVAILAETTTLKFDILNSTEVFKDESGKDIGFKWSIYGLEFHAESRAYSK